MAIHTIKTIQNLPVSLEEAWEFISSPYNLKTITPDDFRFEIINDVKPGDKMHAGQIIIYKLRPLPFMKIKWVSEITEVKHLEYFVDEQLEGPYRMWRHQHFLKVIEGGTQMQDVIQYKIPYGFIGTLLNFLFVRRKLNSVFEYRRKKLESIFGKM
jgi:ligand-binding SRPBCC domain-containing protein